MIDGDTIAIDGLPIRLDGIDAPEKQQTGMLDGKPWPCGLQAAEMVKYLTLGQIVTCHPTGRDRYGRTIAKCFMPTREGGKIDIGGWLVEHGWAWAFRRYSMDYVPQEDKARADRAPIWRGTCQPAWEWRAERQSR
jgi:endonuclease YncB( thermonuclease family)